MNDATSLGRRAALGLSVLGLSACAAPITFEDRIRVGRRVGKLPEGGRFYVALPQDGYWHGHPHPQSGLRVAAQFQSALLRRRGWVAIGHAVEHIELTMFRARGMNTDFVFVPRIVDWSERLPHHVELAISVFETRTGHLHEHTQVGAIYGGPHPHDALMQPVENYVAGLF